MNRDTHTDMQCCTLHYVYKYKDEVINEKNTMATLKFTSKMVNTNNGNHGKQVCLIHQKRLFDNL